jgi:tetratricopeptide (TPR) repeat protein
MNADRSIADKALTVLREWGWETGLSRLKEEIAATEDEQNRAALSFLVGWLAGERGEYAEAEAQFQSVAEMPALAGWALVGQAFIVLREKDYERAHQLLDGATTKDNTGNAMLLATATHCRGAVYFHQGRVDQALASLHEALRLFGTEHFAAGRVLDTLGMVYASKNNFQSAREFYEKAIDYKRRFQDDASIALSHGQLGRLHLDLGDLNRADKALSRRSGDIRTHWRQARRGADVQPSRPGRTGTPSVAEGRRLA